MHHVSPSKIINFQTNFSILFCEISKRASQATLAGILYCGTLLMNTETYDQQPIPKEMLGDAIKFLKEQDEVEMLVDGDRIIAVELPNFLELKVESAEPGVRGDTANNVTKPATLETGVVINVPLFVNPGDKVRIDTRTGKYVERVR